MDFHDPRLRLATEVPFMSQKVRRVPLIPWPKLHLSRQASKSGSSYRPTQVGWVTWYPEADLVEAQGDIAADVASRHFYRDLDRAVSNRQRWCGSLKPDHTVFGTSGDADILHPRAIGDGRCH